MKDRRSKRDEFEMFLTKKQTICITHTLMAWRLKQPSTT